MFCSDFPSGIGSDKVDARFTVFLVLELRGVGTTNFESFSFVVTLDNVCPRCMKTKENKNERIKAKCSGKINFSC